MRCRRCESPLDAEKAETLRALDVSRWDLRGPCAEAEANPPAAVDDTPAAFSRHLRAAQGFLELGLPHEAWV